MGTFRMAKLAKWAAALCTVVAALMPATQARAQGAGACCLSNTNCQILDECACKALGGFFIGPGATCTAQTCSSAAVPPFGACCFQSPITGLTCVNTHAGNCQTLMGSFLPNTPCSQAGCGESFRFACCCPDGSCVDTDPNLCQQIAGANPIAGALCASNPCPGGGGFACCLADGTCIIVPTPSQCQGMVVGNSCVPNPCDGTGQVACCRDDGSCFSFIGPACPSGTVPAPGNTCSPNPCRGACCAPGAACFITTIFQCQASGGQYFPAGSCTPDPCVIGCCEADGTCFNYFGSTCPPGTTPAPGGVCGPIPCPTQTPTACCATSGACFLVIGPCPTGTLPAPGNTCTPNPCFGACCEPDGVCFIAPWSQCPNPPFVSFIPAGSCQPNPCPRACCRVDGSCFTVNGPCPSGTTPAPGNTCSPNQCRPGFVCCTFNGVCTLVGSPNDCNGFIVTGATSCTPNPCVLACCDLNACFSYVGAACPPGTTPAPGNTCSPNPCPQEFRVCCRQDGSCVLIPLGTVCNGFIIPTATSCVPNPCFRACCRDDGSCFSFAGTTCPTGTTPAPGNTCTPNNCPQPDPVACCRDDGSCFLAAGSCPAGTIAAPGNTCTPNGCRGACCRPDGSCFIATIYQCLAPNTYIAGASCAPNPCPGIACCRPNGSCVVIAGTTCKQGWIPAPGNTCTPNPCRGACCRPDGTCYIATIATCLPPNVYYPSTPCSAVDCPGPQTHACCDLNACFLWVGPCPPGTTNPGTITCTPNPCVVACCRQDGSCIVLTTPCPTGTTPAPGNTCSPNLCPIPLTGACCIPEEPGVIFCIQTAGPNQCAQQGGVFQGFGVPCTPNPCRFKACCDLNACFTTLAPACPAGTVDAGTGTCTPNPCPRPCCLPNGVCVNVTAAQCASQGGVPVPGAVCSPNIQCRGACCCGTTCFITTQQQCENQRNTRFVGFGTACNPPGNNFTPCCKADYNQSGTVSVQDIFSFLADYFGGDLCADANGSGGLTVQDLFTFLALYFQGCP